MLDAATGELTSLGQPFTFPMRRSASEVEPNDSSIKFFAPFATPSEDPVYPEEVLTLLSPSLWTFELYYDSALLHTEDVKSGQHSNEGVLGGYAWDSSIWFQSSGAFFGIAGIVKTISGIDEYEPITFNARISYPLRQFDAVSETDYWLLSFGHQIQEASPGVLLETIPVEYESTTHFASSSLFKIAISRTDLP